MTTIPTLPCEPAEAKDISSVADSGLENRPCPSAAPLRRREVSILSPLRYPGSKRRLAGYVAAVLRLNELRPELFVEPFVGGASVSLQLLSDGLVQSIGLVDRDPLVASFWKTVFFDTNWLVEQIRSVDVSLDTWDRYKSAVPQSRRDRALACIFLNRTSFSGILAPRSGPLGGRTQQSTNKLDCRFPRETLVKRVEQAGALRDRVAFVWNESWKRSMSRIQSMQSRGHLPQRAFYYFDPPFFEKADRLYTFSFDNAAHRALRDVLRAFGSDWLLSYDSPERVADLYGDARCNAAHVEILYSTSSGSGRGAAREVLLSNLTDLPAETRLWRRSEEWNAERPGGGTGPVCEFHCHSGEPAGESPPRARSTSARCGALPRLEVGT